MRTLFFGKILCGWLVVLGRVIEKGDWRLPIVAYYEDI